jgi:thiamine-phosphate pyrophosphorylase
VVEDFTRFVLDDRHLTEQLKTARHDLTAALAEFGSGPLLVARDTVGDVGTTISTDSENRRDDPASVATASFKRVQEALRSLEEYGKLIAPAAAARLEQLRYRLYTLERVVMTTVHNVARLSEARLYVLMDGRESLEAFRALVTSLVEAGVDVLQLRDKQLSDRDLLARAEALRSLTAGTRTRFVMNDRADLARLSGADGVHVGQDELTVAAVRRIVGPEMIVGVSTHSLEQARQAVLDGADYLGVGPVFPSTTKTFPIFPGTELLRSVAAEISLPAFAIGGITLENLPTVLASGIRRVAISGAIINSTVPGESARRFRAALETV